MADPTASTIENHTEDASEVKVEVQQLHMGMMVSLTVYAPSLEAGRQVCRAVFERVSALDQGIFSDYRAESELRRLAGESGFEPVRLSPELFTVLEAACRLAAETEGRFDPTAGPVIRLWRQARKQRLLPDPDQLQAARVAGDFRRLRLDPVARTVAWSGPAPELDLGAIAKGYIGDQALVRCRELGAPRAMFAAGGDMVLGDAPPQAEGWPVDVPLGEGGEVIHRSRCAISISGDTSQYLDLDGVRYSHVIDARSGQALTHRQACLVIAPTGLQADALATAGTLLEPAFFRALLQAQNPPCRGWVISAERRNSAPGIE